MKAGRSVKSKQGALSSPTQAKQWALTEGFKSRVLLVDDDEIDLALIGDQLEAQGLHVSRASSGSEALALMDKERYPVLLTDWHMPVMDGIELTSKIRARGMLDTYIIIITSQGSRFESERGYSAGINDYLLKKLPAVELYTRLNAAFDILNLRRSLLETQIKLQEAEKRIKELDIGDRAAFSAQKFEILPHGTPQSTLDEMGETTQIPMIAMTRMPKVLLVDDDEIVLEHLKLMLVEAGYPVTTVTDGAAALAVMKKDFMPIVIMDCDMPSMDGLTLCRTIRKRAWSGYVYLLLFTTRDDESDILEGLNAGADDYLSKRTSDAQLIARLNTASRVLTFEHSLKRAVDDRSRIAMTDALTSVYNRRYFLMCMSTELKRSRRFGAELSLLLLDIDHFKQINDFFGHATGDDVLQQLAQQIQKCLPRDYDWCARLGGEEFVVVLPQTNLVGAKVVAEKIRIAIACMPIATNDDVHHVTVSIGVSGLQVMEGRQGTVSQLLADADKQLYRSKKSGRNRVCVSPLRSNAAPKGHSH